MNCEYCRCRLFDTDRFCPSCGAPITKTEEAPKDVLSFKNEQNTIKISGFSQETLVALGQKVSAWNGGRPATMVTTPKIAMEFFGKDLYSRGGFLQSYFGMNLVLTDESPELFGRKIEMVCYLMDGKLGKTRGEIYV